MSNETRAANLRFLTDKNPDDVVAERHDMVLLFDATKANPNGDPDADNMPRTNPMTLRGFVTDGCLKRKVRNFFSLYHPDSKPRQEDSPASEGYEIFVRESAIFESLMRSSEVEAVAKKIFTDDFKLDASLWTKKESTSETGDKKKSESRSMHQRDPGEMKERAYRDALCKTFFDVRTFGQVASTKGPLFGSFYGQIRGPIQFSFAESLDKILQLDASITRCALASVSDAKTAEKLKKAQDKTQDTESVSDDAAGNRTFGRKRWVDYGLYRTHIYFSPAFAQKTKFTYRDLDNFIFALQNMFRDDSSAARPGGMRVVGLVDFEHSTALGNAPAHKLFEQVIARRTPESEQAREFPESLADYYGSAPIGTVTFNGDASAQNGDGSNRIIARRFIWDIPAMPDPNDVSTEDADSKNQSASSGE